MRAFTAVAKEDWPAVKGYYRLIDQPADSEVTPENILRPHRDRSVRRMRAQSAVLCIQDGTDVNFGSHPQTTGLGVIGRNQTGAQSRGLHLHSTLALTTDGLPLGVLRTHFDAPEVRGQVPASPAKKSDRWIDSLRDCATLAEALPNTHLVSVTDREADFYALFAAQQRTPRVALVVHAKHDRRLPGDQGKLFALLRNSSPNGHLTLEVTRQSAWAKSSKRQARIGRQAREAQLELRYRRIEIARDPKAPPEAQETLPVTVVHAVEPAAPNGEKPIEWFVLTTLAIDSPAQAAQILRWYSLRWRIEDWHRVLKSGCNIDELGHRSAERLERAIPRQPHLHPTPGAAPARHRHRTLNRRLRRKSDAPRRPRTDAANLGTSPLAPTGACSRPKPTSTGSNCASSPPGTPDRRTGRGAGTTHPGWRGGDSKLVSIPVVRGLASARHVAGRERFLCGPLRSPDTRPQSGVSSLSGWKGRVCGVRKRPLRVTVRCHRRQRTSALSGARHERERGAPSGADPSVRTPGTV